MSIITLRDINIDNWQAVYKLDAGDDGKFVAPNAYSMLEAIYDPAQTMRAIYADETLVGFMLFGHPSIPADFELPEGTTVPEIALKHPEKVMVIFRLMVDKAYQGNGYGGTALKQLLDAMQLLGQYELAYISFEPENTGSERLYKRLGFQDTGLLMFGEKLFQLDFKEGA